MNPIVVSESGSVIDVSEEQQEKAATPIIISESGSVINVSEEHSRKASSPIILSESGRVIEISDQQPIKAFASIAVGTLSKNRLMGSRCAIPENLSAAPSPEAEQQSKYVQ
jgi:hypothetical protein